MIDAWIVVLDEENRCVWSNRAWRLAMNLSGPRAVGAAPRDYYDEPRLSEFERALRRVREKQRPIRYDDAWLGRAVRTTIQPLAGDRVLMITNVTIGGVVNDHHPRNAETIEFHSKSWGPLDRLTRREREVLALLASGMTVKDAANAMERSDKTIEGHRDAIYRKLGARSRVELATFAVRSGLLPAIDPGADSATAAEPGPAT